MSLAYNPVTAPVYYTLNRDSWMNRGPAGQAKTLYQAVQHPGLFLKSLIDWEQWKTDPMRAYGETVPSLIIAAATMGTGAGSGITSRFTTLLRREQKPATPVANTQKSARSLNEAAEQSPKTAGLGGQDRRAGPPSVGSSAATRSQAPDLHGTSQPKAGGPAHGSSPGNGQIDAYRGSSQRTPGGKQGPPGRLIYGNSPYNPDGKPKLDPNGKPLIQISDEGLSSIEHAVRTPFHESRHQRNLAERGVPGIEREADKYEEQVYREFVRKQRGRVE
ncbi:hypothetical protein [Spirillospora albida]|uniref:hypothetical protein n=1 Tax=Spirillospora albida TaxID=58123 RepID=UPI0012F98464|nr:hypothetical protein [Spirillospora albida]